jgi:hypothetical protein
MKNYDIFFDSKNVIINDTIKEINKIKEDYFLEGKTESISYFPKFSAINIIVGSNNSGKSRFMRYLMAHRNLIGINNYDEIKKKLTDYNLRIESVNETVIQERNRLYKISENAYYPGGNNTDKKKAEILVKNRLESISLNDNILGIIESNKVKMTNLKIFGIENYFISNYTDIESDFLKKYDKIKRYFIPTLRTAHSLFQRIEKETSKYPEIEGDFINKKIEEDIFLDTLDKYYQFDPEIDVFTGIHLYNEILNTRNSKKEIRQPFEKFEAFIGKYFFVGKKVDIVAEFDKSESLKGNNNKEIISLHIEGEKDTREFHQLGDGIQALIILMYKIFMAEKDSFIFIDEPELNLHPGMQRLFLEQISSNKDLTSKNLTYIISTHSNHFLDLTIEKENVSIYSFSKQLNDNGENKFIIKNVNAGDNQILKNLGVNNSSVFLANSSIWVEGISDRNYIKSFLLAYCNEKTNKVNYPKEDIDFAFFEYAGGNIEHYIFGENLEKEDEDRILNDINTMALSNRIFLLADSDMVADESAKNLRLKKLEKLISEKKIDGKIFRDIRESENLLSKEVWKKVVLDFCNKKLINGREDEILINLEKQIDKTILEKDKYIGDFLKKIKGKIPELNEVCKKNNKGTWQTFRDKAELSRIILHKTVEKEITWDDFKHVPEVVELTESIYNFIRKDS